MVWLQQPPECWREFCYYTSLPHLPLLFFALLATFLALSSSPLFSYSVRIPPLQFDALPQLQILGTTKYPLGFRRSMSFSKKLNIDLYPLITTPQFLKSLWVCFVFMNFLIPWIYAAKNMVWFLYNFVGFQIMLLWVLQEVEDLGVRMSIKVVFFFFLLVSLFLL